MAQKLWEKSVQVNKDIERFTVGRDREMDLYLAKHDVIGSMAHITMLESIGLLTKEELVQLLAELRNIYASAEKGELVIEELIEERRRQGLTQQDLADMTGILAPNLARLESRKRVPTLVVLQKYASALGMHIEVKLCDGTEEERYTRSDVTNQEYDTDVKRVAKPV